VSFAFVSGGQVIASTLPTGAVLNNGIESCQHRGTDYLQFSTPLVDEQSHTIGELHILRSFDAANRRIADLRHRMIGVWLVAVLAGLALTYLLARRILRLSKNSIRQHLKSVAATTEFVSDRPTRTNWRLSATFNSMAESIQTAREDLIRQERIFDDRPPLDFHRPRLEKSLGCDLRRRGNADG